MAATAGTKAETPQATKPHTDASAAAGRARRLANSETRDSRPPHQTSTGATAIWAPAVTAAAAPSQPKRVGRRALSRGVITSSPHVAAAESCKPGDQTRKGSRTTRATNAPHSRSPGAGRPRPRAAAPRERPTMAAARSTEGCQPVRTTKAASAKP